MPIMIINMHDAMYTPFLIVNINFIKTNSPFSVKKKINLFT